jgi:hypothetical protein
MVDFKTFFSDRDNLGKVEIFLCKKAQSARTGLAYSALQSLGCIANPWGNSFGFSGIFLDA